MANTTTTETVTVTVDGQSIEVPRKAWRLVRGVKNGPSPEWLQKRLTAIGLRPINARVVAADRTYKRIDARELADF